MLKSPSTLIGGLAVVLAIVFVGRTPSAEAQDSTGETGVVIEEVGKGSVLEKAGLRPGDVVTAWERLPSPPANPEGDQGRIESVFDWMWVELEQAPRGPLKLSGQRGGKVKVFEVLPGIWKTTVRARMPEATLEVYERGKELIEAEETETGIDLWHELAGNQVADGRLMSWLLFHIGDTWFKAKQWEKAQSAYEGTLEIQKKLAPGSLHVAKTLHNLGVVARNRSDLARAVEYHEGALEIQQKLAPDSLHVAVSLINLGVVARDRSDLTRAVEYYEETLEIQQKLAPDSLHLAHTLNNLGNVAAVRGELVRAMEYHERALEIRQKLAPGSLDVAISFNNLGAMAIVRRDLARAVEYCEGALEIMQRLVPGSLHVAKALNNLGLVAGERGDSGRAVEYYEGALEIAQTLAPGSRHMAMALNHLGVVAGERGDLTRAVEYHKGALEIMQKLAPRSLSVATVLVNLGNVAAERDDLARAAEYYERALEIRQKLAPGSIVVAISLKYLATVRRKQDQPQLALALFLQALKALETQLSQLGGSRDARADFRARWVDYYRDTIDLELELHQPEAAFHTLERSRAQSFLAQLAERDLVFSGVPEELESRRRRIAHRYDRIQDDIAQLNPRQQADEIEDLLDLLRGLRREHEDVTEEIVQASPKLGSLRYPKPLDYVAAQATLDPGTVMLSYSVGEFKTHLFVLTRDVKLRTFTLPIGKQELRDHVQAILKLQSKGASPYKEPLRTSGERLYQALIQPAEDSIAKSKRILVVPDRPLHLLPFALLIREAEEPQGDRDFEYLVEWKPLHSVLSATVYDELKKERRSSTNDGTFGLALAAFGDPQYPNQKTGDNLAVDRNVDVYVRTAAERGFDFAPLPYTRDEVTRIAALYPEGNVSTYLGTDASEEQAKSVGLTPLSRAPFSRAPLSRAPLSRAPLSRAPLSRAPRILHFATHGRYDDKIAMNSFLALTMPEEFKKGRDNGLLQTWEIFEDVRLDADLVVLSACETGLGGEMDGEGLIGLTRAFQFAGARTVAATLWQVDDRATAELMTRFYRHLRAGMAKDEALRAAQLDFIRGPVEMTNQQGRLVKRNLMLPYYWAAFQIIGDWR